MATSTSTIASSLINRFTWRLRGAPAQPASVQPEQQPKPSVQRSKSTTVTNAAISSLLRLPAELRCRIWQDLLTGHHVHICRYASDRGRSGSSHSCDRVDPDHSSSTKWFRFDFDHAICQEYEGDDEPPEIDVEDEPSGSTSSIAFRDHDTCLQQLQHFRATYESRDSDTHQHQSARKLPLHVLRICQKIYWETHTMPYNGNSFHFSSPADFFEWAGRAMSLAQKRALRRIHIENRLLNPVQPFQGIRDLEPGAFAGLTDLTLFLEHDCMLPGLPQNPFRNCRRLKNVTVVCGSVEDSEGRERAEEIESVLRRR